MTTIKVITEIENWDKGKCDYCDEIPSEVNFTHILLTRNVINNQQLLGTIYVLNVRQK